MTLDPEVLARLEAVAARYDDDAGRLLASVVAALERRLAYAGKTCRVCRKEKPHKAFGASYTRADGLDARCRECEARRRREERAARRV